MNRRAIIAGTSVVIAVTSLMSGCSTTAPSNSSTVIRLDKAKASAIQGLPVPVQAAVEAEIQHTNRHIEYGLAGIKLSSLDSWYEKQLPPGSDWKDWTWVSPNGPGCLNLFHRKGVTRTWVRGSSMLTLGTSSGTSGAGIVIEVLAKPTGGLPIC
jgi:hypothetical protein